MPVVWYEPHIYKNTIPGSPPYKYGCESDEITPHMYGPLPVA